MTVHREQVGDGLEDVEVIVDDEDREGCGVSSTHPAPRVWWSGGRPQAALDAGQRTGGLTTEEHEELRRLRRENRQLREERAILSKAAAWFARETNAIPSKDSSS